VRAIVETYIVRIYRREAAGCHRLVGVVEEVGVEGKRAFVNLRGLWKILDGSPELWAKVMDEAFVSGRSVIGLT
jgi:hypothetical protein